MNPFIYLVDAANCIKINYPFPIINPSTDSIVDGVYRKIFNDPFNDFVADINAGH